MLLVERVTVEILGTAILSDVDIEVQDGEVLAVLGPSGSGKTTLLRTIAGLQPPTRGTLRWDGEDLARVPVENRGFGLMFQDYALFPHQSIGANVAFGLRMQRRPVAEIDARVSEVLDWVGLPAYADRRITNLSGGEQQRVALARALAPAPRLLMLDEPLGSLDRILRERLIVELRQLLVDHSITAVYVTHDQEEAFTIADRLLVLRDGTVAQEGTPESVYRQPVDEWTARFLGFRNIVRADVTEGTARTSWGSFPTQHERPGSFTLVIPPDAIELDPNGAVRGIVDSRVFRGGHHVLGVSVTGETILDVEIVGPPPEIGAEIKLRVTNAVVL